MNKVIEKRRGKFERFGRLRKSTAYISCSECGQEFKKKQIKEALYVCPGCGHYYAMPPEKRIMSLMDENSFKVFNFEFPEIDPLDFEGYVEKKE